MNFTAEELFEIATKLWGKRRGAIDTEGLKIWARNSAGDGIYMDKAEVKTELLSLFDNGFFRKAL